MMVADKPKRRYAAGWTLETLPRCPFHGLMLVVYSVRRSGDIATQYRRCPDCDYTTKTIHRVPID